MHFCCVLITHFFRKNSIHKYWPSKDLDNKKVYMRVHICETILYVGVRGCSVMTFIFQPLALTLQCSLQDDSVWGSAATHQGWKGFGPSQWEVATARSTHKGHK